MNMSCGKQSKCKTSRCFCRKNNQYCKPNCSECNCNGDICSNIDSSSKQAEINNNGNELMQIHKKENEKNYGNNESKKDNVINNYEETEKNSDDNIGCECKSSKCKDMRCRCKKNQNKCTGFCNCQNCLNRNEKENKDDNYNYIENDYELRSKLNNLDSNNNNILPEVIDKTYLKGCNCKLTYCRDERCGCRKSKNKCNSSCGCKNCNNQSNDLDKKDKDDNKHNSISKSILIDKDDSIKKYVGNQIEQIEKFEVRHEIKKNETGQKNKHNREQDEELLDINFIASLITEKIRKPNVSVIKDKVFSFRNDIDLYTLKNKDQVIDPDVDHIIEDQILGHAAARALGNVSFRKYVNPLKDALNLDTLENYNVTFSKINRSKGAIFKNYLQNKMYQGYPIRSLVDHNTHFGKNLEQILVTMNQTYPIVLEYLESPERKCDDNFVSGSGKFEEIANEFKKIIKIMKLDLDSEMFLRSRHS